MAVVVGQQPPLDRAAVQAIAITALDELDAPSLIELSIHFVGTDEIAGLNREALGRSGPTDVVSLPLEDLDGVTWPTVDPNGPPLALGDVFIAPEVVRSRAIEHGFDPIAETALMVVHGVLHLCGLDHAEDASADRMESIETAVLERHGFGRR